MNIEEPNVDSYKLLADTLLDCRWTLDDHLALTGLFSRRRPVASAHLFAAVHGAMPYAPSRKRLVAFLVAHPETLKGLRWKQLAVIRTKRLLLPSGMQPSGMQPSVASQLQWEVPPLPTVGALADNLLGLPLAVVDWLCNQRIDHFVIRAIAKRGPVEAHRGPWRILEQPKARLKTAQRDILREVLRFCPAHPAAHGFVAGRSVVSFARPHAGREVVLRMDLANFFPSIHAARVAAVFRSLGYPRRVVHALTNLCVTTTRVEHIPELSKLAVEPRTNLQTLFDRPHLPQGAPTSPSLANLVAYRLDARLSGLASAAGLTYTRYADDLLFSGDRPMVRTASSFIVQVAAIVLDEGFQLQHRKTRLMPRATRQSAAGVILNQHLNTSRNNFDNLKATLFNCVRLGPASQNREGHTHYRSHLLGRISWVTRLNPTRGKKLMELFRRIDWSRNPLQ